MDENRKKRGRKAHLNDFQKTVTGEYIYTGKTYQWDSPRGRSLLLLWLLALAAFGGSIAGGCIPNTGMERHFWSLLPYAATLIVSGVQGWTVYRLTDGGNPIRDYVWQETVQRLPVLGIVTAVLAAVTGLATLIGAFLPSFTGNVLMTVLFLWVEVAVILTSLLLRRVVLRLKWN